MKDSRIQSPGASKLIRNSKHNLLRRDTETSTTQSDYIYLSSIPLFLIKKIILWKASSIFPKHVSIMVPI